MDDERFSEAVKVKNAMSALIASEGWQMLDDILREREANLLAEFTDETQDYSDEKLREFRIGLKLIRTIRMTPPVMLADAEEIVKKFAEEEEAEPVSEEEDYGEES